MVPRVQAVVFCSHPRPFKATSAQYVLHPVKNISHFIPGHALASRSFSNLAAILERAAHTRAVSEEHVSAVGMKALFHSLQEVPSIWQAFVGKHGEPERADAVGVFFFQYLAPCLKHANDVPAVDDEGEAGLGVEDREDLFANAAAGAGQCWLDAVKGKVWWMVL